jgi:hypothetical protein
MHRDKAIEVNVKNCLGYSIKASWKNRKKDDALFEEYVELTEVIRSGGVRGWTYSYGLNKFKAILDEYYWELTINLWKPVFGNKRADRCWWTNDYWKDRVLEGLKKLEMWSGVREVDFFGDMSSETTSNKEHSKDNSGLGKSLETKTINPLKKYFSNRKPNKLGAGKLKRRIVKTLRDAADKRAKEDPSTVPKGDWFF